MSFLNWICGLFKRSKAPETAIYVKTQEQADAINGFFDMADDVFMKIVKLSEPSYGRVVTFEFDMSNPESQKMIGYLKTISEFNGNGYADIKVGEHYVTLEFQTFEDAEALRQPFVLLDKLNKERAENKSKRVAVEKES